VNTKNLFLLLFYCGAFMPASFGQSFLTQRFDCRIEPCPLSKALLEVSKITGITIGFSGNTLDKSTRNVSLNVKNQPLHQILDALLDGSGFHWTLVKAQVIIARGPAPERLIAGYVEDALNHERLAGAMVYEQSSGRRVMTNAYGFYSFRVPARTPVSLRAAMPGYATAQKELPPSKTDRRITFAMDASDPLKEVIISADSTGIPDQIRQDRQNDIARMPLSSMAALGGEPDLVRAIAASTPGVSGGPDGFGGHSVRGGDTDHNLILLDDATIFYPSHGLGLFTIINTDMVRSARFWKGDAPAHLASRIGSVLDVRTREGNTERPAATASAGWVAARLTLELPLKKEKGAVLWSARRSLVSPLLRQFSSNNKRKDNKTGQSDYHFADMNLKLNWIFGPNDRVFLSGYAGSDTYADRDTFVFIDPAIQLPLSAISTTDYRWKNISSALRWNHLWSDALFSNTTITASTFDLESNVGNYFNLLGTELELATKSRSILGEMSAKTDWEWFAAPGQMWRTGFSATRQNLRPFHFQGNITLDTIGFAQGIQGIAPNVGWNVAGYLEHDWRTKRGGWHINWGLRMEWFAEKTGSRRAVPSPRLAVEKHLTKPFSATFSASRRVQAMRSIAPNALETMSDFWMLSNRSIPLQEAWQTALGGIWNSGHWLLKTELFYKKLYGIDEYRKPVSGDTIVLVNGKQRLEDNLVLGTGEAFGLECLAQWQSRHTQVWLSYTLSEATRQFPKLNAGRAFPARFSRLHDVKLVIVQQFGAHFTINANWTFGSGDAVSTLVFLESIGKIRFLDLQQTADQGQRTGFGDLRQPSQHRLDFSANWQWTHKKLTYRCTVGAYNAYNHTNRYFTYKLLPITIGSDPAAVVRSVNGLSFLPSVSFAVSW
jgi:hypothetical protein